MPTYEYQCSNCSETFTVQARMQDPAPQRGPQCSRGTCSLQKKLSRVYGHVAGSTAAPQENASQVPSPPPELSPTHVCSKYCDLHKG